MTSRSPHPGVAYIVVMRKLLLTAAFALALTPSSRAVASAAAPERGRLVEDVACASDPTQTYTLYLPSHYDATKRHPLLFVLDPRGRGTVAAKIFREAAEEFGWILISSNQTRSDTDSDVNEIALRALVPEALQRYSSDRRRIYSAGFSGTAMISWGLALNTKLLAGVIAVGGRQVPQLQPRDFSFASYGFAGVRDFNNREMLTIDDALGREGKTHRFRQFDGAHEWIGPELAREAVGWMEVIAMRQKLRPPDLKLAGDLLARDLAAAAATESAEPVEALRNYEAIVRTYEGLLDVAAVRATIERLHADAVVRAAAEDETKWNAFESDFTASVFPRIPRLFAAMRQQDAPPSSAALIRELRVRELQKRAGKKGAEGRAAGRLLEAIYTQMGYYMPQNFNAQREHRLAVASLGVAAEIHPERPAVHYNLACAHALAGDRRRALDALEKAVASGWSDRAQILNDDDLASLHREPRFTQIVGSLAP